MGLDIFLIFEDGKIKFQLNLPNTFLNINEDEYFKIENESIYECNFDEINFDILNKNLKAVTKKINEIFYLGILGQDAISFNDELIIPFIEDGNKDAYKFIKNSKNLKIKLGVEDYRELIDNLGNTDYPNLKISFKNSYEPIPYKDFYLMFKKLNEVNIFIKHFNLSPLETLILVYDIVKANEYKKEEKDENYGVSRNLNEIINSGKIVCVGFSNLMNFFLNNLGIECKNTVHSYSNKETKHERNFVCLKDDKYNINKILFLDSTWDSKKDDKYIDNYKFFLKPLSFFKHINNNEKLDNYFMFEILYSQTPKQIFEFIKEKMKTDKLRIAVQLNEIFNKANIAKPENLLISESLTDEEIQDIVSKLIPIYFKGISKGDFKNALYKVRRIEYLNKIIPFEPNEKYIDSICDKLYLLTAEERLLQTIFGENKVTLKPALNDVNATNVKEDLLRIRLIKALKEKLNDFPDNDYIKKM